MKSRRLLISSLFIVALCFMFTTVHTNIIKPNGARTGAPGELHCGDSTSSNPCHNVQANVGPGNVSITFANLDLKYVPGDTVNVTVTVFEAGILRYGFELTALNAGNDSTPGKFVKEATGFRFSRPFWPLLPKRRYVGHDTSKLDGHNTWTFLWASPTNDIGDITFYAAGNAANGDSTKTGDHIYTTSLVVHPDTTDGIVIQGSSSENGLEVQSLVYHRLNISYQQLTSGRVQLRIYDLSGNLVQTLLDQNEIPGTQTHSLRLHDGISSGLYLLRYSSGDVDMSKKIFIER